MVSPMRKKTDTNWQTEDFVPLWVEALVDGVGQQSVIPKFQHAEWIALPWRTKTASIPKRCLYSGPQRIWPHSRTGTVQISGQQIRGLDDFDLQKTNIAQVFQRPFQTLSDKRERAPLETNTCWSLGWFFYRVWTTFKINLHNRLS